MPSTWTTTTTGHDIGGTSDTDAAAWAAALAAAADLAHRGVTTTITVTIAGHSPATIIPALDDAGAPITEETAEAIALLRDQQ